jgi:hypothetical protein
MIGLALSDALVVGIPHQMETYGNYYSYKQHNLILRSEKYWQQGLRCRMAFNLAFAFTMVFLLLWLFSMLFSFNIAVVILVSILFSWVLIALILYLKEK